jgi:6,7-dimethyl-8-ribityllumazine synthase
MKIGVIASRWNSAVTDKLLSGAVTGLQEGDIEYEVVRVPGAFEIPLMALKMAESGDYDGLIALGVVIKGETLHYEMICRACVDGILKVTLDTRVPIAFEVLMVDDVSKAKSRASDNMKENKGHMAVAVVTEMIDVLR